MHSLNPHCCLPGCAVTSRPVSVLQQDMSDSDEEKSESTDSDEDDETSGSTDSDDDDEVKTHFSRLLD